MRRAEENINHLYRAEICARLDVAVRTRRVL